MELRTLRYFLTAANEGNITRAAEILHVTQPTLSRQLMELERELETTLVIRGKKGLTLTDDGYFFRQRAEEIVSLADRLEQSFAQRNETVSGVISLGATEVVGFRLLAKVIKEFSQKHPMIHFRLYNEMADAIRERIDKGLVDIGLLMEPVDIGKYNFFRLPQRDTWGVLVRRDDPLAQRESLSPREVVSSPSSCLCGKMRGMRSWAGWGWKKKTSTFPSPLPSCPTRRCWWRRALALPSAWTGRWPPTPIQTCGLYLFPLPMHPTASLCGRRTTCFPPLRLSFSRRSIC